jgi:LPS export ABC transporter protein LptC
MRLAAGGAGPVMKAWRPIILLMLLAVAGAALWFGRGANDQPAGGEPGADTTQVAYDYEAHDVVLRQMGPDGRLSFQIEARQITQLPDTGRITAQRLTLYHDPTGTEPGGPNRWTLTADSGELPVEGGIISVEGHVRAEGIPVGSRIKVTFTTSHLQYDVDKQELCSNEQVQLTRGSNVMSSQGLCFNIQTNEVFGSEANVILAPR